MRDHLNSRFWRPCLANEWLPLGGCSAFRKTLGSRYLGALSLVVAATLIRLALHPTLGNQMAWGFFILATLCSALYFGSGPGVLTGTAGLILGCLYFRSTTGDVWQDWLPAAAYVAISVLALAVARARWRAEESLLESQTRLELALESAGLGTWELDVVRQTVNVSPRTSAMFGLASDHPLLADWLAAIHIEDRERVRGALRRAADGPSSYEEEYRTQTPDVSVRWVLTKGAAIRDVNTRQPRIIGIAQDITRRKQAEQEARENEERMRQTQKLESIGLLVGGIAHDFNNILTTIGGNITLALDHVEHTDARDELKLSSEAVERAAGLTRQLLAYAGKSAGIREPVSASAVARSTLTLLQATLSKKLELRAELGTGLPAVVMDPSQMQQVLMNLIINGAEAVGDTQSGVVTVRTWHEGAFVCIEVSDSGCGIDKQVQEHMFEPFFTTKLLGRGLGLAAVQGIVRSMNGNITVDSTPGKGTCIRVLLPCDERAPVPEAMAAGSAPIRACRGRSVLVVDDEPAIRRMAAAMLKKGGISVYEASTGQEAIDCLAAHSGISVVLLDMAMPEMSGEEALERIAGLGFDVHVIVSSGYNDAFVKQQFGQLKFGGFLPKPYTAEQLLAHVLPALEPQPNASS